jgi:hypothetical protein
MIEDWDSAMIQLPKHVEKVLLLKSRQISAKIRALNKTIPSRDTRIACKDFACGIWEGKKFKILALEHVLEM